MSEDGREVVCILGFRLIITVGPQRGLESLPEKHGTMGSEYAPDGGGDGKGEKDDMIMDYCEIG